MNEKLVNMLLEYSQTGAKLLTKEVVDIGSQYIDYLMVHTGLCVLQSLLFLIVPFVLFRVVTVIKMSYQSDVDRHLGMLNFLALLKALILGGSIAFIVFYNIPQFDELGKLIVAPKVVILEEVAKLRNK